MPTLEPSYVVFGTSPWSAPWLTEQNLAHALAARHRVLYVEPPMTPLTPFRYGLTGARQQLARAFARGIRRDGNIAVYQPIVLPPATSETATKLSAPLFRMQVARVVRRLGLDRPVVVSGSVRSGLHARVGGRLEVYVVKDWVDDDGHLLGRDASSLAAERDAMCARADLVCAISPQIQAALAQRGFEAELLRHGFHDDLRERYDAPPPGEYAGLPRPLLGFAGRIDGRLDVDLLCAVADHFTAGSLVLIGPVTPRLDRSRLDRLLARPNVHHLGPFDRTRLPPYLAHVDCSLVPYRESEWARHGSPLKLWDYLYAGPPIVGSGYTIVRDYEPEYTRFASGAREFVNAVEESLREPAERRAARRAFALRNTWDARAEQLEQLVRRRLGAEPTPAPPRPTEARA